MPANVCRGSSKRRHYHLFFWAHYGTNLSTATFARAHQLKTIFFAAVVVIVKIVVVRFPFCPELRTSSTITYQKSHFCTGFVSNLPELSTWRISFWTLMQKHPKKNGAHTHFIWRVSPGSTILPGCCSYRLISTQMSRSLKNGNIVWPF